MKTRTMHMMTEGASIANLAIQGYNFEENEELAVKLLKEGFVGISDKQVMNILNGDAVVSGWSICDDSECDQCKGLSAITYEEKEDVKLKTKIQNHKLWLNKEHFKVGQFYIRKKQVEDYCKVRIKYTQNRDLYEEDMEIMKNSFWSSNQHRRPSENYMPREGSLDWLFSNAIVPFIDEINQLTDKLVPHDNRSIYEVLDTLGEKHSVLNEDLESSIVPKGVRAEGCILVTVHDDKDKPMSFNLEKAMYLQYVDARRSSIRKQKITMSQDIEKAKVMKRFAQYEKTVGYAHKAMMKSMNLYHSESGSYSTQSHPIEHDVNGLLRWYMWKITIHNDDKEITSIPNELTLSVDGDAYVDGKLVEEKIDLR